LSIISAALKAGVDIPGAIRKRVDDIQTWDARSVGNTLGHVSGQMFEVGDAGILVKLVQLPRKNKGSVWQLVVKDDKLGDVVPNNDGDE